MKPLTVHYMSNCLVVYKQHELKDNTLVLPTHKGKKCKEEVAGEISIMSPKGNEWSHPLFGCFDDVTVCRLQCYYIHLAQNYTVFKDYDLVKP